MTKQSSHSDSNSTRDLDTPPAETAGTPVARISFSFHFAIPVVQVRWASPPEIVGVPDTLETRRFILRSCQEACRILASEHSKTTSTLQAAPVVSVFMELTSLDNWRDLLDLGLTELLPTLSRSEYSPVQVPADPRAVNYRMVGFLSQIDLIDAQRQTPDVVDQLTKTGNTGKTPQKSQGPISTDLDSAEVSRLGRQETDLPLEQKEISESEASMSKSEVLRECGVIEDQITAAVNPALARFQTLLNRLAEHEFGTFEANRDVADALLQVLHRLNVRLKCPVEGCGLPSTLHFRKMKRAKNGVFQLIHSIDGRHRAHCTSSKLPPLVVISPEPDRRFRDSR